MLNGLTTAFRRNPYPVYRLLRKVKPLLRIPKYDVWFASNYDDVKRILSDHKNFSSDFRHMFPANLANRELGNSLIISDPPVHTKLRALALLRQIA